MKQKIAILASGPSLHDFWSDNKFSDYETVIGVNSACRFFKTSWAICVDKDMVDSHCKNLFVSPSIGFISVKAWKEHLKLQGKQYREVPGRLVGCYWSFCNALFFANSLKRSEDFQIDVYGFDCAIDQADCQGINIGHSLDRFSRELIWIRAAWTKSNRVFSTLKPEILDWLTGKKLNLEL